MKQTRLSADKIREILLRKTEGQSFRAIGRELGIDHTTARKYWLRHVESGQTELPEFTDKPGPPPAKLNTIQDQRETEGKTEIVTETRHWTPSELKRELGLGDDWIATHCRHKEWNGFYKLKDGTGHRTVKLCGSSVSWKKVIGDELRDAITTLMAESVSPWTPPDDPLWRPAQEREPFAVSWGIWDAHLGMYAFGKETGEDYDVDIAFNRVVNSVDDMVAELSLYNVKKIFMPVGNDFLHFDNVRHRTAAGDHNLDCDSRFARVYRAAVKVLVYMVERARSICEDVDVFWIPGNHDVLTSYTLCAMLRERFREDPRVSVDISDNPQKIRRWGGCALFYDHGKDIKPGQFPLIFHEHVLNHARANELDTDISYKEVQIGHTHQKRVRSLEIETPTNGIQIVTNPALCNVDYWHHSQGLIGEPMKSVEARRYDTTGFRGSHVAWARDDDRTI